jgi:serine/threonine protein kinase
MGGEVIKKKLRIEVDQNLQSPFLVPTLDTFRDEAAWYIVMPFYEKGNLTSYIDKIQKLPDFLREYVCLFSFIPFFFICCLCRKCG